MSSKQHTNDRATQDWISLLRLTISPNEWNRVPTAERGLIITCGHILNELNVLNRLMLTFQHQGNNLLATKVESTEWQAKLDANVTQTLFVATILAGKLCEVAKFLQSNIFQKDWFKWYRDKLSENASEALKKYLEEAPQTPQEAKSHPLTLMRDLAGFHYDSKFLNEVCSDDNLKGDFTFYLARGNGNTLYWGSTQAVFWALLNRVKPNEHERASEIIMGSTIEVSSRFKDFLSEFLGIATEKYFPDKLKQLGQTRFKLENLMNVDDVKFPFYTASSRETPDTQP